MNKSKFVVGLRNARYKMDPLTTWHLCEYHEGRGMQLSLVYSGTFIEISEALESEGYEVEKVETPGFTGIFLDGVEVAAGLVEDFHDFFEYAEDLDLSFESAQEAVKRINVLASNMAADEMLTETETE